MHTLQNVGKNFPSWNLQRSKKNHNKRKRIHFHCEFVCVFFFRFWRNETWIAINMFPSTIVAWMSLQFRKRLIVKWNLGQNLHHFVMEVFFLCTGLMLSPDREQRFCMQPSNRQWRKFCQTFFACFWSIQENILLLDWERTKTSNILCVWCICSDLAFILISLKNWYFFSHCLAMITSADENCHFAQSLPICLCSLLCSEFNTSLVLGHKLALHPWSHGSSLATSTLSSP